jgi:hypothetical protein
MDLVAGYFRAGEGDLPEFLPFRVFLASAHEQQYNHYFT